MILILYEIHEAFAGQVLSCLECLNNEKFCREKLDSPLFGDIPFSKINVQGEL